MQLDTDRLTRRSASVCWPVASLTYGPSCKKKLDMRQIVGTADGAEVPATATPRISVPTRVASLRDINESSLQSKGISRRNS